MGRIGRSYPRFEEASKSPAETAEAQDNPAFQTLGAIIGILCALSLIGWVLMR
jgi:flagellar biogenesis protein FliO